MASLQSPVARDRLARVREGDAVSDTGKPRVSVVGRLAARAVTLALDAANAPEDVEEHLLRLARGDAAALERAAGQVERRHHHPESGAAQLAIRSLRSAASLAVGAAASATGSVREVLA